VLTERAGEGPDPDARSARYNPTISGEGGQRFRAPHPAPAGKMRPVFRIGLQRFVRRCRARIVAGGVDQAIEGAGAGHKGRKAQGLAVRTISLVDLVGRRAN